MAAGEAGEPRVLEEEERRRRREEEEDEDEVEVGECWEGGVGERGCPASSARVLVRVSHFVGLQTGFVSVSAALCPGAPEVFSGLGN